MSAAQCLLLPPATPLCGLALVTSGAFPGGSLGTATSRERFCKLPPASGAQPEETDPGAQSFWERGLLGSGPGCSRGSRILIKHSWGLTGILSRDFRVCVGTLLIREQPLQLSRGPIPLGKSFLCASCTCLFGRPPGDTP